MSDAGALDARVKEVKITEAYGTAVSINQKNIMEYSDYLRALTIVATMKAPHYPVVKALQVFLLDTCVSCP